MDNRVERRLNLMHSQVNVVNIYFLREYSEGAGWVCVMKSMDYLKRKI
tara:strand:- start:6584 stop:6727 length:144 start_codon:yes stop_codon:yes gene_type:complete